MAFLGVLILLFGCSQAFASGMAPVAYTANTASNTVSVIDMSDDQLFATIYDIDSPSGLAASPDGGRLYVVNGESNNVTVIDTSACRPVGMIPVGNMPHGITLAPDGKDAYVTNYRDNTVSIINTAQGKVGYTIKVGNGPCGITANPMNGEVYALNSEDGSVAVIRGHGVFATIPVGNKTTGGLAVTPDGSLLLVANSNSNSVSIINTTTYRVVNTVNTGIRPQGIALSPDGSYAYIANAGSQNISILQLSDNTVRVSFDVITPSIMAFRPDGKILYLIAGPGGNVLAMDSATGDVKATFNINASDMVAGMVSSSALTDKTPPVTTLNLAGTTDANGAFISGVTCNLTAVDYPSGLELRNSEYSLDGISWTPYVGNFTLRTPINITVYYRSVDASGNKEPIKVKVVSIVAKDATALSGQAPSPTPPPAGTATPAVAEVPSPSPSAAPKSDTGMTMAIFVSALAATVIVTGAIYYLLKKK